VVPLWISMRHSGLIRTMFMPIATAALNRFHARSCRARAGTARAAGHKEEEAAEDHAALTRKARSVHQKLGLALKGRQVGRGKRTVGTKQCRSSSCSTRSLPPWPSVFPVMRNLHHYARRPLFDLDEGGRRGKEPGPPPHLDAVPVFRGGAVTMERVPSRPPASALLRVASLVGERAHDRARAGGCHAHDADLTDAALRDRD